MAWIEVHQSLRGHKKLSKLCELLNIKCEAHAVGYLVCLWMWALDNAPDGNLEGISDKIIINASSYNGTKKEIFVNSLIESGFLNEERALHDWFDYAGRLMEKRQVNAERMRAARRKAKEEKDVQTQDACGEREGLPYPTVPNRTQPDQTTEGRNNQQQLVYITREQKQAKRAFWARLAWMEGLPDLCRDACGEDTESLVYWLLYGSGANDDQICCALEYMQKRHLAGDLRKPKEYVMALIKDWQDKGLDTADDIQKNREDFFA